MRHARALIIASALTVSACDQSKITVAAIHTPDHIGEGAVIACGDSTGTGYIRDPKDGDIFHTDKITHGSTDIIGTSERVTDISYKDAMKSRSATDDGATIGEAYGSPADDRFAVYETYASDGVSILRKFSFPEHEREGIMLTMITRDDNVINAPTGKMLLSNCIRHTPAT